LSRDNYLGPCDESYGCVKSKMTCQQIEIGRPTNYSVTTQDVCNGTINGQRISCSEEATKDVCVQIGGPNGSCVYIFDPWPRQRGPDLRRGPSVQCTVSEGGEIIWSPRPCSENSDCFNCRTIEVGGSAGSYKSRLVCNEGGRVSCHEIATDSTMCSVITETIDIHREATKAMTTQKQWRREARETATSAGTSIGTSTSAGFSTGRTTSSANLSKINYNKFLALILILVWVFYQDRKSIW